MAGAGPGGKAQHELAIAERTHLMALTGIEMDQARCCERPLAGTCADEKVAPHDEYECVLMYLVFLQGLALRKKQRDDAVCIIV
jgi:hypothetical protein